MRLSGFITARYAILSIAACALGAWLFALWFEPIQSVSSELPAQNKGWQQVGAASPFGQTSRQANGAPLSQATVSASAAPSIRGTSLEGTQADGDWGLYAHGQLRPSRALRQRFDYYLSLTGEMPLANIEMLLQADAQANLKQPALGQVLDVWHRYVKLQQHDWRTAVDLRQPSQWSAALIERQTVRRQLLGSEWAHAFYLEEESQLQEMLSQINSPARTAPSAPAQENASPLHPEAAQREAAVQAQWQQWAQRLNQAREQVRALQSAPELSAPQREQAIELYLSRQFDTTELLRARALLGV